MTAMHIFVLAVAATVGYRLVNTCYAAAGRVALRIVLEIGMWIDVVAVIVFGRFLSKDHPRAQTRDVYRAASVRLFGSTFMLLELSTLGRLKTLLRASVHRDYTRIRFGRLVVEVYPGLRDPIHPSAIDVDALANLRYTGYERHGDYDHVAETFVRRASHASEITRD